MSRANANATLPTKRDAFLSTMEQIVPWAELCSVIACETRCWTARRRAASWASTWDASECPTEKHKRGEALFAKVGEVLQANGLKAGTGPIVDATIVGAPSSTKSADKQRDPEDACPIFCTARNSASTATARMLERLLNRAKSRVRARVEHVAVATKARVTFYSWPCASPVLPPVLPLA